MKISLGFQTLWGVMLSIPLLPCLPSLPSHSLWALPNPVFCSQSRLPHPVSIASPRFLLSSSVSIFSSKPYAQSLLHDPQPLSIHWTCQYIRSLDVDRGHQSVYIKWLPYSSLTALETPHIFNPEPIEGFIRSSIIWTRLYWTEIKKVLLLRCCSCRCYLVIQFMSQSWNCCSL